MLPRTGLAYAAPWVGCFFGALRENGIILAAAILGSRPRLLDAPLARPAEMSILQPPTVVAGLPVNSRGPYSLDSHPLRRASFGTAVGGPPQTTLCTAPTWRAAACLVPGLHRCKHA